MNDFFAGKHHVLHDVVSIIDNRKVIKGKPRVIAWVFGELKDGSIGECNTILSTYTSV